MPRKKKSETPKVEEKLVEELKPEEPAVEETVEVVAEEPVVAETEPTAEEETAQAQPQEVKEEVVEPEVVVELTEAERLVLLEQQLLDIYEASTAGRIPMWKLLKETGASIDEIKQTWDRLYDLHKVPSSQFYKPETGRVALEG